MIPRKIIIAASLCIFSHLSPAQEKFEKEYRINKRSAPSNATSFIDECFPDSRIKWYREESTKGTFFEAKIRHSKTIYSIKFDQQGNLQDTERTLSFKDLPVGAQKNIRQFLERRFATYSIIKLQEQWLADKNIIKSLIVNGNPSGHYKTNYELEIRGKAGKDIDFFEFLFNQEGKLVREYKIVEKNFNNLIF
ncbi:hypothetical protein Pedsa_1972 [Pseudopedobacter saltans DSM 12145]|uniref:Uncharacterized protein n=1 Tax=Pseudopedobacter saltans (strain ATCC 51119 / DSM 12145 / JCM 21818 / CCUG 39354 / LMG 10337 / NBRC 100064 / NCIMB 13643) TaxID=762903 RepID=F0S9W7_PSESL|nr:hypothetical protein [Pseudopedobacter saltans]ADY52525.1 hypothetical protein Pedsa_1972 [Pseudopedobacter saltans DSM 12145]